MNFRLMVDFHEKPGKDAQTHGKYPFTSSKKNSRYLGYRLFFQAERIAILRTGRPLTIACHMKNLTFSGNQQLLLRYQLQLML